MRIAVPCPRLGICGTMLVLAVALLGGAVPADAATVRATRPRIWLTPTIVARLRASAAANSVRWTALKTVCDQNMGSTSPWMTAIGNYALAYQITGNAAYGDKAIQLAKIQVDKGIAALQVQGTHGYEARTVLPDVSIAYDWCYDRFTPELRAQFRAQLEAWADWIWPETNPNKVNEWSINDPGDNFYHGYMMTWIVGLALSGDSSKAQGYLDRALSRWNQAIRPFLEKYEAGGYMLEGTSYGNGTMGRIFAYLSAHQTATGEDLLNASGFAWGRQAVLARLYQTLPERIRRYPGGDQPRDASASIDDYDRTALLVAMNQVDTTAAGYARWWLDNVTPNRDLWRWMQWEEMLWYRDDIPAVDYRQVLPTGYWASGAGWMTSRSDWGPDATYVAMNCGPFRQSHQDMAQNDFMIYRKEWLAASARLKGGYGILRDTQYHNTFTIGGLQQPEVRPGLPQDLPRVLNFADTSRYAYFVGEAKDAYAYWVWPSAVQVLNSFRRHLVYLKPNRVLVFDKVDAIDPSKVKKWLMNTINQPSVSGNTYQTSAGSSTLFGTMLLPQGGSVANVPINQGPGGAVSSWRIDISAPVGANLNYFLNVLEVASPNGNMAATRTPAVSVATNRSSAMGAQIGSQVVLFDMAPSATSSLTYQTTASEHFIVNLTPGMLYTVSQVTNAGATQLLQGRASDQGVLTFALNASGGGTFIVNPVSG